ncbi:hypothetical protein ACJZ2D_017207 [Fusarium nematophilum]
MQVAEGLWHGCQHGACVCAITGDVIGKISVMNPPSFVTDPDFSPGWHAILCRFFAQITLYTHTSRSLWGMVYDTLFSMPRWADLERIPYFAAYVKEGLRMSHGSMRRVPRCSPDVELQYGEYTIPKGAFGMSAYMMHTDAEVFSEPFEYRPERWVGAYNPLQNRSYIPFSKGSRNCCNGSGPCCCGYANRHQVGLEEQQISDHL